MHDCICNAEYFAVVVMHMSQFGNYWLFKKDININKSKSESKFKNPNLQYDKQFFKDTNRKIRTKLSIEYCGWILVPNTWDRSNFHRCIVYDHGLSYLCISIFYSFLVWSVWHARVYFFQISTFSYYAYNTNL